MIQLVGKPSCSNVASSKSLIWFCSAHETRPPATRRGKDPRIDSPVAAAPRPCSNGADTARSPSPAPYHGT